MGGETRRRRRRRKEEEEEETEEPRHDDDAKMPRKGARKAEERSDEQEKRKEEEEEGENEQDYVEVDDDDLPFEVGHRVLLKGRNMATVRFIGSTDFADGVWVGVEMMKAGTGKNDGSVSGKAYFECAPGDGLFVREDALRHYRRKIHAVHQLQGMAREGLRRIASERLSLRMRGTFWTTTMKTCTF